ncbi:hypothetical protein EON81_06525 [bacterium]|nr:MAG: hypothetical protein EON81_06525 [bacterium]
MARGRSRYTRPQWDGLSQRITLAEKQEIWKLAGYTPHAAQLEVHSAPERFKILSCGRRWGKTEGIMAYEGLPVAVLGGWWWHVAPDYATGSILFDKLVSIFTDTPLKGLVSNIREGEGSQRIVLRSGGVIWVKTSYHERRLRGRGLDFVSFDEAGQEPRGEPWTQALRPALADRRGGAILGSTPKGWNWFKDVWDRGDLANPDRAKDHRSFCFPSATNPYLKRSELAAAKRDATQMEWEQEWLAMFLANSGTVFRNYLEAMREKLGEWTKPGRFVIGMDVARHMDYTAIWVLEAGTLTTVDVDWFQDLDTFMMQERLYRMMDKWPGAVALIDGTNDEGFVDLCIRDRPDLTIEGLKFTGTNKRQLVNQLSKDIESGDFVLPASDSLLVRSETETVEIGKLIKREFGAFQYSKTAAGNIKMEAAAGFHDDLVTSAVLAREAAASMAPTELSDPRAKRAEPEENFEGQFTHKEAGGAAVSILTRPTVGVGIGRRVKRFSG